ncbi:hypothetical protein VTL71DRAFT_398 [Oculimacula yallundae]|uniref:Fucose-specific lectin n=1 Tax=Oculimacula yallundae TaxID=86028 RepID=A0ABR4D020_9HELO
MGHPPQAYSTSPVSPLATPLEDSPLETTRNMASVSPSEQNMYYDEKIFIPEEPMSHDTQVVQPNRRPSHAPEAVLDIPQQIPPPVPPLPIAVPIAVPAAVPAAVPTAVPINFAPPGYTDLDLPSRPQQKPFWKRHILWIAAVLAFGVLIIGIVVGVIGHSERKSSAAKTTNTTAAPVVFGITNNTRNSVASTGLFVNNKTLWNTHVLWQSATGTINLQISLDSITFRPEQEVRLSIPPKLGSPLSATTSLDSTTGVVSLSIFYISGRNNITMSTLTCSLNSDRCKTVENRNLPTQVAPSNFTGLAAVNVNEAQDWRVYYHDADNYISELQGDVAGFNLGKKIGGQAMNASSMAAININSTTNNIHIFYIDGLTQTLFKTQFIESGWTKPSIVSPDLIGSWNPRSGLGAAYTKVQDQLHVYYTGTDAGIYEFLGSNASKTINAKWAVQPGHNHLWHTADVIGGPIAAIGWADQARFYQLKEGALAEGHLNGTTWTEAFIDMNGAMT